MCLEAVPHGVKPQPTAAIDLEQSQQLAEPLRKRVYRNGWFRCRFVLIIVVYVGFGPHAHPRATLSREEHQVGICILGGGWNTHLAELGFALRGQRLGRA